MDDSQYGIVEDAIKSLLTWECTFNFNEGDQTVNLCNYMHRTACLWDRADTTYPSNTVYRFPPKYTGAKSLSCLRDDLSLAAITNGFKIGTKNKKINKNEVRVI
ncbi:MAG: hypothetical protein ACREOZ_03245 [Gloeomargaritales cyanobacterium]